MPSLNFKGKNAVWNHHLSVPYHVLEKDKKNSLKGKNEDENLIIEGDNLLALKSLLPKYQGKIKCIYIDPPYNTGNEGWVYNDNVNNPIIKTWIGETVGKEGEDMTRHDKWLCMMTPRLKLLRELLSDDGVIFVSIDENEVHHLKSLLNEVFISTNFIAELPTVMNLKGNQDEFGFAGTHEYTLVYAKNKKDLILNEFDIEEEDADEWEEDEIGFWKKGANLKSTGTNAPKEKRRNLFFPIYVSKNNEISLSRKTKDDVELYPITDGKEMSWRWSASKVERDSHDIIVVRNGNSVSLYKKQRPDLGDLPSKKPKTLFYKPEYSSGNGTAELKKLFGTKIFDNPKPVDLIYDFLKLGTSKNVIVLDSFAGSGTTAQAVLDLNKDDHGSRKFILVQIEEPIKEKTSTGTKNPAYEAGYRYVHEITRDRVKKVIERDNLDIGFTYYKLGASIDGKKLIEGKDMPSWESLAKYVYNLATGKGIDDVSMVKSIWQIKGTDVYLIYKDSIEDLKNLAITREWLESVKEKEGRKIVYAPACFLDKETLDEYNISFVQIPFNLFTRI